MAWVSELHCISACCTAGLNVSFSGKDSRCGFLSNGKRACVYVVLLVPIRPLIWVYQYCKNLLHLTEEFQNGLSLVSFSFRVFCGTSIYVNVSRFWTANETEPKWHSECKNIENTKRSGRFAMNLGLGLRLLFVFQIMNSNSLASLTSFVWRWRITYDLYLG